MTDFPNIPLPCSSTITVSSLFATYIPRPTKSVGSRVAATPSVSSLADTIKSSLPHQISFVFVVDASPSIAIDVAPSGVKLSDVNVKSNGNDMFANLADNTGGGLPLLPSNIARGTLSGLLGRAVTYSAALFELSIASSMDAPDCNVALPLTYTLSVDADAVTGDDAAAAITSIDADINVRRECNVDVVSSLDVIDDDLLSSSVVIEVECDVSCSSCS